MQMFNKDMPLLDIVYEHPETEAVFHSFDEILGQCLLCTNLFDTIEFICATYGLNESELLTQLNASVIVK
ncbi:hypothetical protein [Fusibacter bizertensis]